MSFKEAGQIVDYVEIDGQKVPRYKCETEVTLKNTQTGQEYNSDKEAEDDINDPNTATQKAHIRRDDKITVPKLALGAGTKNDS